MRTFTIQDFQQWGRQGGAKSRRTLTSKQARAMQRKGAKSRRRKKREP